MGLLDSLFQDNQGGYGGLLDFLQNSSPLLKKEEVQQPQYDQMGNPLGQASIPQNAADPFGPVPNLQQWAQQFAPKTQQPFNVGAAPLPGMAPGMLQPAQQPQPAPEQSPVNQVNDIGVGGYQMPRMGSIADYTPQAAPTDVSAQSRQPAPAQQPQGLPPAFGGAGSILGRLGNPDGLIARLTGNDSRSVAQQNLKAKYDNYLANGLTHSQAMLAAMNPKASEVADQRILEKKQYGFQKLDNDTVLRTDPLTGKVDVAYSSDKGNTIQGPDGKMIEMPAGADPKTWRNEITRINADVAAGKKTEVQAKAEIFANKMEQSNKSITDNVGTSLTGRIASGLPLGNYVQSPEYQKYKQASSNFITALLRQESGAAISKSEFDRYDKEYMPQPGDSKEVLTQKTEARRVAIDGMKKGAGPGYKSPAGATAVPGLPSGWSVSVR